MGGLLTGVLALVALEVLVSNQRATGAVNGVFGTIGNAAQRFFDPSVPAIGPRPVPSSSPNITLNSTLAPTLTPAQGANN